MRTIKRFSGKRDWSAITSQADAIDVAVQDAYGRRGRVAASFSLSFVGWVIGYLLCYGWSQITIYNTLTGTNVPISIYYSALHYIVAGGISLICCTGAAFFPARKATRVHPVEIIRGAS